jgi:hypothetical protein
LSKSRIEECHLLKQENILDSSLKGFVHMLLTNQEKKLELKLKED